MTETIDPPVSTRIKISGLWVSVLFIFAYVDIFSLYRLDVAQGILDGKVFVFDVSQTFLALLYTLTIVGSCIGETWIYFLLGSAVEVILLLVLVRYAWKMPG